MVGSSFGWVLNDQLVYVRPAEIQTPVVELSPMMEVPGMFLTLKEH